jgi:disulfide bond formation protein DsbB
MLDGYCASLCAGVAGRDSAALDEVEVSKRGTWQEYLPYLAFGTALVATLGSLYYSEIVGFIPCTLCWYQRILMYPLILITLVGILTRDERLPHYVLPLSAIGLGFSIYHYLIQLGVIEHTGVCAVGVPCNARYVNYFGFVTIPFMAGTAFAIITVSMALAWRASTQDLEAGLA